jgi:hypothetical protein
VAVVEAAADKYVLRLFVPVHQLSVLLVAVGVVVDFIASWQAQSLAPVPQVPELGLIVLLWEVTQAP